MDELTSYSNDASVVFDEIDKRCSDIDIAILNSFTYTI